MNLFVFSLILLILIFISLSIIEESFKVTTKNAVIKLVDMGVCIDKNKKHLYKNGKDNYTILFFDKNSNVCEIPEEKFTDVEHAVTRWMSLTDVS